MSLCFDNFKGKKRKFTDDDNTFNKKTNNFEKKARVEATVNSDDDSVAPMSPSETGTGINFDKYDSIPVKVSTDQYPPIESFAECDKLPKSLLLAIDNIGYKKPTPIQKHALPIILAGRDFMATAQTGSGKTAAFLFPFITALGHKGARKGPSSIGFGRSSKVFPLALIMAPTRELAIQIHEEAKKFTGTSRLKTTVVYGGTPYTPQAIALEQGVDIIVATPGRLQDLIDRGKVSLEQIQYLCLDEADQMLDMGFEPQIRAIVQQRDMPKARQTVMFSATFPKQIRKLAEDFLKDYVYVEVGKVGSTTDNIKQRIKFCNQQQKKELLKEELQSNDGQTLVFVETKRRAAELGIYLSQLGFPAKAIHGDIEQAQREASLRSFKQNKTRVLVATSVAARGLDISNVAHVINFDLPSCIDDYVHRIGRTGRAGKSGLATAFFSNNDRKLGQPLAKLLQESKQELPPWLTKIAQTVRGDKGRNRFRGRGGNKSFGNRRGGGFGGGRDRRFSGGVRKKW